MKPGIVVVTYDSADFLEPCLESALAQSPHVVVVDNASRDCTLEVAQKVRWRYPSLRIVANPTNRGFATAVNQGVRELDTEFILLLNPDARVVTSLAAMVDTCAPAGAVGGRLRRADGDGDQRGFCIRRFPTPASLIFETLGVNRLWPGNPINKRYRALDADLNRRQPAEQPAGAFLMFRRSCWEQVGGFDERFHPLWFEDVDFLARLHRAGYEIWYEPRSVAIHTGAHSIAGLQPSQRQQYWYGNLLRYAARHFQSKWTVRAVAASVLIGYAVRRLAALPSNGGKVRWARTSDGSSSVWSLAGQGLLTGGLLGVGVGPVCASDPVPVVDRAGVKDETTRKAKLTNSHSHGL